MRHTHFVATSSLSATRLAIACAALLTIGCKGGDSTAPPVPVASVEFQQENNKNLLIGETHAFQVQVKDGSGNVLSGRVVSWATSAPAVASVSGSGLVTALTPGNATITATSEGKTAFGSVTVLEPVASVVVEAPGQFITVGETMQLQGSARSAGGGTLGRTITWNSSDNSIATVSSSGQVTGVGSGPVTISASSEGKIGQVQLIGSAVSSVTMTYPNTILPMGQTFQLSLVARNAQGSEVSGVQSWSSSAPTIASISAAGALQTLSFGITTITGRVDHRKVEKTFWLINPMSMGTPVTGLSAPDSAEFDFALLVPAGTTQLTVTITGNNGDADLYVIAPTQTDSAEVVCASFQDGSNETCVIDNPEPGYHWIAVYAYIGFQNVTLTATATSAVISNAAAPSVRRTTHTKVQIPRGSQTTGLRRLRR